MLLRFEMMAAQKRVVSKSRPNFTFLTPSPVKIRGGVGENGELEDRVYPMTEPVVYI